MGRTRQHASAAERQRAYRQRLAYRRPEATPPPRPRPPSRPRRLAALSAGVQQLRDEYQEWLSSLPESLEDSRQAQVLAEAVEQLEAVVDLLSEIQPPRGFGRD